MAESDLEEALPACCSSNRHDPLQRALQWLRHLETGEVASRAAIAPREAFPGLV